MRILYLIDNYSLGGAQTVIRGIFDNNPGMMDIFAVALRRKKPVTRIDHRNATCLGSKSKYSPLPLIFLIRFIRKNNIDLLHCQLPRSIVCGYLLKRFFFPGITYIIHEQGDIFESRIYAILLRVMKKKADGFIACSEATRKKLSESTGIRSEKISTIYNFVDLNRFKMKELPGWPHFNIGFAGRIEKRKGWREFVQAAGKLKPDNRLGFFMAGTGREKKKLIRMLRKNRLMNIEYAGFIQDMEGFYRQLNLLVIPSLYEPMGMVAVEAMACGIPVLASDVPGLNEVIKHGRNGWLMQPGSAGQMAFHIRSISEAGREEMQVIIRNNINDAQAYSFYSFYKKLLRFYIDITIAKR
ncbi:MAG: glycosyltransferase family 4 protein [Bacteroidales bacterium]|nr:glycosyltransferase family 4 protein [Bacteroidales bacterium]